MPELLDLSQATMENVTQNVHTEVRKRFVPWLVSIPKKESWELRSWPFNILLCKIITAHGLLEESRCVGQHQKSIPWDIFSGAQGEWKTGTRLNSLTVPLV